MKFDIIFENEFFVAVNKPSGLLSIPDRLGKDPSLKMYLQERYEKIFTIHRLDKDTSGLIIFAKEEATHKFLSQAFEGREVQKYYLGLVNGVLMNKSGSIDAAIMEAPGKTTHMITHEKKVSLPLPITKGCRNWGNTRGCSFKLTPEERTRYVYT